LQHVNASIVRNRLLVRTGERYSPSQIEKARQDLLSLGVFAGVTVRAVDQLDAQGRVPVVFDVQERLRRAVGLTAAYSTDLGGSARATWSHRNLFGNAEQLNLAAGITGLGGRATTGLGYNLTAQYIKPDFLVRDQSLEFNVGAIRQKLDAYDQDALTAGVLLNRKFSDVWSASVGLAAERERIVQDSVTRDYTLLGVPVSVKYNSTGIVNPLMDPVRGIRAALTVTPTQSFGASSATFVIIQGNAAAYIDLASIGWTAPGRSVIALRTLIGSAQGASLFSLPPDQRFYGGGSGTVRGFRYQSIGPQFSSGKPIGGNSIDTATIELRQRLVGNFGAAAFIDAGQVSADSAPFQGTVRVGAGIGMRYYTPIGPIRLRPFNEKDAEDSCLCDQWADRPAGRRNRVRHDRRQHGLGTASHRTGNRTGIWRTSHCCRHCGTFSRRPALDPCRVPRSQRSVAEHRRCQAPMVAIATAASWPADRSLASRPREPRTSAPFHFTGAHRVRVAGTHRR
jgi:translocation and assembly module TamA